MSLFEKLEKVVGPNACYMPINLNETCCVLNEIAITS